MTGSLRSSARNPIAIAIMGALILVFLVLGVGGGRFPDAFRTVNADAVVTVGDHSMNTRTFERNWEDQKQKFEQQTGQDLTNQFLVQNGVDVQLLSQVAQEEAMMEMLSRSGITPAPQLIDDEFKKQPWAFDKVTGQFSQQQFLSVLAANNVTPRQIQSEFADQIAVRHFGFAVIGNFQEPLTYVAVGAAQGTESRDVSYFIMGMNAVPAPPQPSDAQLTAFIKEHAAQLMQPEMRVLTLVRFSAKDIAPTIKIDPAQVAKEFAFRKDSLSTPEKRSVVDIPVKTAAQASDVARRLAAGEDPSAIARSIGVEAVNYDDKPQSAFADDKLGAAAFAAKDGAVVGPVAGDLSLAVIKVLKVTPGAPATLASATPQIEAELRQKQAADQAYQESEKFDDARQAGANDMDAAGKAGVTAITLGPVTAQGLDTDGKPNALLTDKILKAAFAMPAGQDGDLEDAGSGEYFAVRVDKVLPPALPSLADKKPQLTKAYMQEALITALKAKANALVALSKKNGNLDAAAAEVGAHVIHQNGMTRLQARQYQSLGREFLEDIFGVKPGEVFPAGGQTGVYIAKVDAVHAGDPMMTAQLTAAIRGRASQAYAEDLLNAVQTAAGKDYKATINYALARQTLGVDTGAAPKAGAKPGAPLAK